MHYIDLIDKNDKPKTHKKKNIAVFVPHNGCPCQCAFCNQRTISGNVKQPEIDEVAALYESSAATLTANKNTAELAFFGGSFTGIDKNYRQSLLQCAYNALQKHECFTGIRISTRPDLISEEILHGLKKYNVTAIELGAQSMCDDVLLKSNRGHNAKSVCESAKLIKEFGFELGLQMMTGLPLDTFEKCIYTANEFIHLKADTARIYPTVVLKNTKLHELFLNGEYKPFDVQQSVEICSKLIQIFEKAKVKILRVGLHSDNEFVMSGDIVAGGYHSAFGELCSGEIMYQKMRNALLQQNVQKGDSVTFYVEENNISKTIGHKRYNIKRLQDDFCLKKVIVGSANETTRH